MDADVDTYIALFGDPAERYDEMVHTVDPCLHRGEELERRSTCACSSSRKMVPVFACDLHGKCADRNVYELETRKRDKAVVICLTCDDWRRV